MNKLGLVLGVAAVATFSGCLDPHYSDKLDKAQNGATTIAADQSAGKAETVTVSDTKPGEEVAVISVDDTPAVTVVEKKDEPKVTEVKKDEPAKDETKPVAAPAAEETTEYIVQRGDYLAKISKKFNVTIASIKRLNPQIKEDNVVRLGQKIKLPGKIDVGAQTVPAGAVKATAPATKEYKPYEGATKEYVVKSGDTLGAIAYGNGINIRQLKEMNALTGNNIRVGQKLKIPAEKVVKTAAAAPAAPAAVVEKKAAVVEKKAPVVEEKKIEEAAEQPSVEAPAPEPAPAAEAAAPAAAPAANGPTHVVKDGEDVLGLSLLYSLDPAEIRALNNLGENDNTLKVGQVIKLPADANL